MQTMSLSQRITELVKALRRDVPECLAAGVVDLSTGMLLALETLDSHPQEVIELVAAATYDLFQGRNVSTIENHFKHRRNDTRDRHYFQEIMVNSDNLAHLFLRAASNPEIVIAVVAPRSVNLGMMLAQTRRVLREHDEFA
jgi:predicted regulator of Ras-like GTPase activity (Roadblock/LC7/MglB family)